MELSGHSGDIFTAKFDLTGNLIASGSMDRSISMYTYQSWKPLLRGSGVADFC